MEQQTKQEQLQQEQLEQEKQQQLKKLKLLLGLRNKEKDQNEGNNENEEKEELLRFVLDKVSDMICNYCRIEKVPKGLQNVMLNMAVELYRAENLGQEQAEGTIKSITEGDVSVSFASASENMGMAFLKDYTTQLDRYRKLGW